MFRIFVCVHSNTPLLQNQELLICRFGIDEKRKTTLNPQLVRMGILQKVKDYRGIKC